MNNPGENKMILYIKLGNHKVEQKKKYETYFGMSLSVRSLYLKFTCEVLVQLLAKKRKNLYPTNL